MFALSFRSGCAKSLMSLFLVFTLSLSFLFPGGLFAAGSQSSSMYESTPHFATTIEEGPSGSDDSSSSQGLSGVADSVYANAGGWGIKSALIFSASSAAREYYDSKADGRAYDLSNILSFAKVPEFWGGLAGDLAFSMAVSAIAPAIPGGALIQTFVKVAAGFVGYEVGSGNVSNADWFSIGMQTLAATVTQIGLSTLLVGVPFAGLIAGVASIGAALGVAYLISKLRGDGFFSHAAFYKGSEYEKSTDESTVGGDTIAFDEQSEKIQGRVVVEDVAFLRSERDKAYLAFVRASQSGQSSETVKALLERYQILDNALSQAKENESATGTW